MDSIIRKNKQNQIVILCKVILLFQIAGMFSQIWNYGSKFSSNLWYYLGLDSDLAKYVDKGAMGIILGLTLLGFVYEKRWIYSAIAAWVFFLACNAFYHGGSFGAVYSPFAHGVRYGLPLSLAIYLGHKESRFEHLLIGLRWGVAITFIAHGIEAIYLNPKFIDFLIRIPRTYLDIEVSQGLAESLLIPIGVIDIFLGVVILRQENKYVLAYMAFWGLLTATVRLMFSPSHGFDPMLIRAANGLVPIAILMAALARTLSKGSDEGNLEPTPVPGTRKAAV
ncbi:hypothetical protein [Pseudobacteriovorax antillogorgiicola]|uniref:DoxX protein n=1 Tax=Pseudobacteriovorax antillogorgiicola TaxID=1513793 RepID=A0A1Y6BWA6_9BACT|nr:hypothetical protein [Pseudobacteriovorax antillogorgiicola]TCS52459.1 hypothetical protein EDD56_109204 [Pseudobacteriovorax antillogorgiicola]SMF28441.1 hypothetical protein SAMN06296036_10910 [Pseudobacteriovorax antillogorgiicola]